MSEQSVESARSSDVSADLVTTGPRYRAAAQRLMPRLLAMQPHEFSQPVTVDIPTLVTSTMGNVLAGILKFRPELQQLPFFDLALVDQLEDILMALAHTQALYDAAYGAAPQLQALHDEAYKLLNVLLTDANAAVSRGLMGGDKLKELRGANGYRNVAFDLMAVVQMFRANFARVEGRTGTTAEELDRAERAAERLSEALGLREKAPAAIQAASELRQRAFNLFLKAYGEAKRGIAFLRFHHGDVDVIVPSVFVGRGGNRKRASAAEPEAPEASQPSQGAVSTQDPPASDTGKPAGAPGGSPFEDET